MNASQKIPLGSKSHNRSFTHFPTLPKSNFQQINKSASPKSKIQLFDPHNVQTLPTPNVKENEAGLVVYYSFEREKIENNN